MDTLARSTELDVRDHDARDPRLQCIADATVSCISRWGLSKTTVDDIAAEAAISRATLYRVVPGGKDAIILLTQQRESSAMLSELAGVVEAQDNLEDALVLSIVRLAELVAQHPALSYLLIHEPASLFPLLSFDNLVVLLDSISTIVTPRLERFIDPQCSTDVVFHIGRLVLCYLYTNDGLNLSSEADVRRFVRVFVVPVVDAAQDSQLTTD